MHWFEDVVSVPWATIEKATTSTLSLHLYLYADSLKKLLKNTHSPFVKNTIKVWYKLQAHLNIISDLSGFTPIWGNLGFPPGRDDPGFKLWAGRGISKVMDMCNDNNILYSLEDLQRIYNIPNFILSASKQSPLKPSLSSLEKTTLEHLQGRGQQSALYEIITDASKESLDSKRLAWSNDLNIEISQAEWKTVCQDAHNHARLKLLQFKWIMRTYITPAPLHHFDNKNSDCCIKCPEEEGTLFHCLWSCPKILTFWEKAIQTTSDIISVKLPACPRIFILGLVVPSELGMSEANKKIIILCSLQAKHCIAISWKSPEPPAVEYWLRSLSNTLAREKLTYATKGKIQSFLNFGDNSLNFLKVNNQRRWIRVKDTEINK